MRASTTNKPRTTATKWIIDPESAPFVGPLNHGQEVESLQYIPLLTSSHGLHVDTLAKIDVDPYMLTRYAVNDYVLRRYPPDKAGDGHPGKVRQEPYVVKNGTCADDLWTAR